MGSWATSAGEALSRARRTIVFSAFLTLLNDRLGETLIFPLLPYLLANLTNDGRVLGLLSGSYALAQFAFTPLIGALSDRHGRHGRRSPHRSGGRGPSA